MTSMPDWATSSAQPRFESVLSSDAAMEHVLLACSARLTMPSTRLAPRRAAPGGRGRAAGPWAYPLRSSAAGAPVRGMNAVLSASPDQSTYRLTVAWRCARCPSDSGECVPSGVHGERGVVRRCGLGRHCQVPAVQAQYLSEHLRVASVRLPRDPNSACISAGYRIAMWPMGSAVCRACAQCG
jgi:hypothetical protein